MRAGFPANADGWGRIMALLVVPLRARADRTAASYPPAGALFPASPVVGKREVDRRGAEMRIVSFVLGLCLAQSAMATLAWGGPGWYVMRFDEGGWHNGLSVPYQTLDSCRTRRDWLVIRNGNSDFSFLCVRLPTAPIPDYGDYVDLPTGAEVEPAR